MTKSIGAKRRAHFNFTFWCHSVQSLSTYGAAQSTMSDTLPLTPQAVRDQLALLGYSDIPDHVLLDFVAELRSRLTTDNSSVAVNHNLEDDDVSTPDVQHEPLAVAFDDHNVEERTQRHNRAPKVTCILPMTTLSSQGFKDACSKRERGIYSALCSLVQCDACKTSQRTDASFPQAVLYVCFVGRVVRLTQRSRTIRAESTRSISSSASAG